MVQFNKFISNCFVLSALLLTISYSQSISYLSPDSGQEGINDLQVYLYASGVNFYDQYSYPGVPSSVSFSGGGINANNLQVVNSQTVKFDIDISQNTSLTSRDVTLQTYRLYSNGEQYNGYNNIYGSGNEFTVTENTSGIDEISPSEVQAGGEYQINIYGSGLTSSFQSLSFSGSGIEISNTQVYSDWIQTTIWVDMLTYTNERDLTVYTNGYTYTLENALTITEPDPIEIVSITPNSGYQGTENLLLDVTLDQSIYSNYYSSMSLIFSGSGITGNVGTEDWIPGATFPSTFYAYIDIASWADVQSHDVTLNVSWQETISATLYNGFAVNESDWKLVSITPNESYRDVQNIQITLQGENTNWGCCGTPQLSFSNSSRDHTSISVDWVTVNSSEQLTAQIGIDYQASYGYRDVTVTSGDQVAGLQNGFNVKPPDATLSPSEGFPGDAFEVTLIGGGVTFNDMYGSANVYFSGSGLNVSNVNHTSDNSMTFYLQVGDTEPGMRDLYVNQSWWVDDYNFSDVFEVKAHLSKIYADPQQVIMAEQNAIPIRLSALAEDQIESVIFAVEVSPTDGISAIIEDLDIEIFDPNATAMISQGGDGIASVIISGFDPAISGQDLVIGNLLVDIPSEGVNQGAIYHLSTSSVSGSTPDYEGITMYGIEDVDLAVITSPPEMSDLSDVYMIEGTSENVNFTVVDYDGTPLSLSYDAPDYVICSLEFVPGDTEHTGTCSINPDMGDQSGTVSLTVTNSEALPETANDSFSININHYPVLNIAGPIYAPMMESTSIEIELSDSDGDDLQLTLLSLPEYTEYTEYNSSSGTLEMSPVFGSIYGEIVFHAIDDGTPPIAYDITLQIIVNYAPHFYQAENAYFIIENEVLIALILFSEPNGDPISYNVDQIPSYGTYSEVENGLEFTFSPSTSDNNSNFQVTISDPQGMSATHSADINVYNTYLAGDVRPNGGENAGEFGDDLIIAPDVVNALRVATSSPDTDIPNSNSSLFDAFDVSPIDIDVNQDGDFYDTGERGGDEFIDAADVIVSLKRATMMPGYSNIRRVDVNYPFSTPIDNGGRIANRDDATDALLFGNIEGHPGETVQVPVTLRRGEGNINLSGLVSGFSIVGSDEAPELVSEISFNVEIDGNSMDIPSGNEFLSLLLMDLDELAPSTETLLGTLDFTIPFSADTEDIYYIYTQGSSGTSSNYDVIVFEDNFIGVVPILENMLGDFNQDNSVDVIDIVMVVDLILYNENPSEYEILLGDINGDGAINVIDIVMIADIILGSDLARGIPANQASIIYGNGSVSYKSEGNLAGMQFEVTGEYKITDHNLPSGWEIHNSENTILLFSLNGSSLEDKTLFEYDGDIVIESAIATDWYGSDIAVSSVIIPKEFTLQSAYPNPFNPVTNLKFGLPIDSEVSIQIFNLQGRVIETLANGNMSAGYHSIVWNADEFGSGLYFVQMISGDYFHTQKIMLVK